MSATINNNIEFVPQNTTDPTVALNSALNTIDALLQTRVKNINLNVPPLNPIEGDCYIVGNNPSDKFTGQKGKLARYLDSNWSFYTAYLVVNLNDNKLYLNGSNGWVKVN